MLRIHHLQFLNWLRVVDDPLLGWEKAIMVLILVASVVMVTYV